MTPFKRISAADAHELMSARTTTIVDIRDPGAFAQEHIAKAVSVSDENIQDFLKETDKSVALICYCYHGISSQRAAAFFTAEGFKEVYSIDGGWEAWKGAYG